MALPYSGLDVGYLMNGSMSYEEAKRLLAAEEFCWAFSNGVGLGLLEEVSLPNREYFAREYDKWCAWAAATGIMPKASEDEYEAGPVPGYMF